MNYLCSTNFTIPGGTTVYGGIVKLVSDSFLEVGVEAKQVPLTGWPLLGSPTCELRWAWLSVDYSQFIFKLIFETNPFWADHCSQCPLNRSWKRRFWLWYPTFDPKVQWIFCQHVGSRLGKPLWRCHGAEVPPLWPRPRSFLCRGEGCCLCPWHISKRT